MKKIASVVSLAALAGSAVVLVPACSASQRNETIPVVADAGGDEVDAAPEPLFVDATAKKDAFNIFEASCATAAAQTSTDPVVLEFVLDGSGSMDSDNKWTAAAAALNAVFDDFLAKNDPKVAVGLIVFADTNDPTNGDGPYPNTGLDAYPQVVDTAHHKALTDRINNTTPSGGTPTYAALQGGYTTMLNYREIPPASPAKDSRKVVILLSDGEPSGGTTEQAQCTAAAKQALAFPAPKGPIKTFSVGIGQFPGSSLGYDPKFMGDLAVAGGTRSTPQCNPASTNIANVCHFQITPGGKPVAQLKKEFINAINRIRGLAVGCEFKIELGDAGEIDPTKINVVWTDGAGADHIIAPDEADGWTYDDPTNPTKVVLNGQSCGDVSQDLGSNVQIVIGCPTGIN